MRFVTFLTLAAYWTTLVSAVDIRDYFDLPPAGSAGNCDAYVEDLGDYFEEAIAVAKQAQDTIKGLEAKTGTFTDALSFAAVFGSEYYARNFIRPVPMTPQDTAIIALVKENIESLTADNIKARTPGLYCDSTMLQWTTEAYDPNTGLKTDIPLQNVLTLPAGVSGGYWFPATGKYLFDRKGGPTFQPCGGFALGLAVPNTNVVILCPPVFTLSQIKKTNTPYTINSPGSQPQVKIGSATVPGSGDKLNSFVSIPGVFLHEMMHVLSPKIIDQPAVDQNGVQTGKITYGYMDAMYLARHAKGKDPNIDQAALAPALNADTYRVWADMCYLKVADWSKGYATPYLISVP